MAGSTNLMNEDVDASQGWCCDGRTWAEHSHADGKCCQPQGQQIEDLPPDAQRAARERLQESSS
jgi:hypothetical protein